MFHVTAITHRKDAVYPATIVGATLTRPSANLSRSRRRGTSFEAERVGGKCLALIPLNLDGFLFSATRAA